MGLFPATSSCAYTQSICPIYIVVTLRLPKGVSFYSVNIKNGITGNAVQRNWDFQSGARARMCACRASSVHRGFHDSKSTNWLYLLFQVVFNSGDTPPEPCAARRIRARHQPQLVSSLGRDTHLVFNASDEYGPRCRGVNFAVLGYLSPAN